MQEYNTLIESTAHLIADLLRTGHRDDLEAAGVRFDRVILDVMRAIELHPSPNLTEIPPV